MNSISQNYINIINNNFYEEVFKQLASIIQEPNLELGVFNYTNLYSTVDEISNEMGKNFILNQFKKLDEEFRDKPNRTKFYHVKLEKNSKYLMSRQTVYNIVKKANLEPLKVENEEREIDTLYVMADEHFIGSQEMDKDHIVKQMIIFKDIELIDKNNRQRYIR